MSDTYFDLPSRLEDSFPEIDSDIVTDLRKNNEEYAEIQQQISELKKQFPCIMNVMEEKGECSATSFLRNWDSILEKNRANLRSISEPARLRQPPPQKHGSGTRKRAGSKHTGGATNSRPSRAFCPLVG